jgi:hypothetical protein
MTGSRWKLSAKQFEVTLLEDCWAENA